MNEAVLGVYGLTCHYGNRRALDEVSFELARGKLAALIGPNGSGKSTLLKLISGVLGNPRVEGQVRVRGIDLQGTTQLSRARQVCYVGGDLSADFPLTALEAVRLSRICREDASEDRLRSAMEECRCWELRDRVLHELSGGERQRVALAKALAQGSGILLLDEALSRMDLDHQAALGQALRARARQAQTIILVSHDLNVATEWADTAILLKDGRKVAEGEIAFVLSSENLAKLYPGVPVQVSRSPGSGALKVYFSPQTLP